MEKGKHIEKEKHQFPWKGLATNERYDSLAYLHSRVDDLNFKLELLMSSSNDSNCNACRSISHDISYCSKEKHILG
jgi:hypothetical protein